MYNNYVENGVIITPNVVASGDNMSVIYKGILYKSGASHVYMHMGYGDKWESLNDVRMIPTEEGFEARIPIRDEYHKINMAFKDCANNWDNNSGRNYTFEVQTRL